jgi:2-phosphoglycerate kinase
MELNLTDEERELLRHIVEEYYSTLREEVYKTEASEFKDNLKKEEAVVKGLLKKLREA